MVKNNPLDIEQIATVIMIGLCKINFNYAKKKNRKKLNKFLENKIFTDV